MPSVPPCARAARAFLAFAAASIIAAPVAQALRIVDYNLLNYPGSTGPLRDPSFRTILAPLNADVVVTEEMLSQAGVNEFLTSVLNTLEPGQWAAAPFVDGNDTDAALFYKPAKVQFLGQWGYYPLGTETRLVHVYRLKPAGYAAGSAELRLYAVHLKASTGSESQRLVECIGVRDSMNAMPAGTHGFAIGDFNFYTASSEPGYAKLQENQANNIGRVLDLLPSGSWHDNGSFAPYHTQSTCLSGGCASGAATGGMDDRFDMILPTYNLNDNQGLSVVAGTCIAAGNDGLHFNKAITDAPTIPEGAAYASALIAASDHLPLRIDVQVPAKISTVASLAFGTVIVGASAVQNLSISNPATPPADGLDHSFTADAGFSAPGGNFVLAAGAPPEIQPITMSTAIADSLQGQLHIASDDPDNATTNVDLSGTVLDHAAASLDSLAAVVADTLHFGTHPIGQFTDGVVRVHNRGYTDLVARLAVGAGNIVGGEGRFSFVGGFHSALVAGVSEPYSVHFDDTGAEADSVYLATLTFTSADETLPGSQPQPDLVVTLRARLSKATDATALERVTMTRLYTPFPNPPVASTTVRFDLAQRSDVRLEVFDVAGRRVAVLAQRVFEPGRHSASWAGGRGAGSALGSGVYFVRLSGGHLRTQTVRVTIVR